MGEKIKKQYVTTRSGSRVRMNEAALEVARKHFGVNQSRPGIIQEVPIELQRLTKKIEIIKAVEKKEIPKVEKLPDLPKVELPKTEVHIVETTKKPKTKKKNEGTDKSKDK